MHYVVNNSKDNISFGGVQFLVNAITQIEDYIYSRFENDPEFSKLIKNRALVVGTKEEITQFKEKQNVINSFITEREIINGDYRALLNEIKQANKYLKELPEMEAIPIVKKAFDFKALKTKLENDIKLIKKYIKDNEATMLPQAINHKEDEINNARDKDIEKGIEYKGKLFQSAKKDRDLLTSTVSLFTLTQKAPDGFQWIAQDNTSVSMDFRELVELAGLMATSVSKYTYKARELKDSLSNMKTIEEVEAVKYE